jgi:Transposase DDE domain
VVGKNETKKGLPMSLLTTVAQAMQTVFTTQAEQAARQSGLCQRASPLGGAVFAQAVTFACLRSAKPSLDQFCQTAAAAGVVVTPQAFDQRFGPKAVECLRLTLDNAVRQVVSDNPAALGLLARFPAVYLQDSTVVTLPDALESLWPGTGGRCDNNTRSAIKFQVRLDLRGGQLAGPFADAGRSSDQTCALQHDELPKGALRIADLGYFDLDVFTRLSHQEVYWLSRWHQGTALFLDDGQRLKLVEWLAGQPGDAVDVPVKIGSKHKLPGRLVALRVPPEVAELRRRRLLEKAKDKGKGVSQERLRLCAWTLLLTNLPQELARPEELAVLVRCRWQIELLFKLWKSGTGLGKSASDKPYRVLCEVFGKMIAVVVQHWVLVAGCWKQSRRSLTKAAPVVREQALAFVAALHGRLPLLAVLALVVTCLTAGTFIHQSKSDPRTWQLLDKPNYYGVPLS